MNLSGVSTSYKKDGTPYYKAYFTHKGHHISLGSYSTPEAAGRAYLLAQNVVCDRKHFHQNVINEIEGHAGYAPEIPFEKWVMLINLRDTGIYCRTPVYLQRRFFEYHLDPETCLRFDIEELFYYTSHKIQRRGGHLFVADYGMQVNIFSRYGIKNYAVEGRDYRFINNDPCDFRAGNIEISNPYHGVIRTFYRGNPVFVAKIHIKGDYVIGKYKTAEEAATAYNKAADYLHAHGIKKNYPRNYIETLNDVEYAGLYQSLRISKKVKSACPVKAP